MENGTIYIRFVLVIKCKVMIKETVYHVPPCTAKEYLLMIDVKDLIFKVVSKEGQSYVGTFP